MFKNYVKEEGPSSIQGALRAFTDQNRQTEKSKTISSRKKQMIEQASYNKTKPFLMNSKFHHPNQNTTIRDLKACLKIEITQPNENTILPLKFTGPEL